MFSWIKGRQGTGYDILPLLTFIWPFRFDSYIIRYPEFSDIPPHRDPSPYGDHYRLNIIIWDCPVGGKFLCNNMIYQTKRIKFFRPDINTHSVTKVLLGPRYVLSLGWIKKCGTADQSQALNVKLLQPSPV